MLLLSSDRPCSICSCGPLDCTPSCPWNSIQALAMLWPKHLDHNISNFIYPLHPLWFSIRFIFGPRTDPYYKVEFFPCCSLKPDQTWLALAPLRMIWVIEMSLKQISHIVSARDRRLEIDSSLAGILYCTWDITCMDLIFYQLVLEM